MKNFENYLREKHADQYVGLDDDMPDDFEDWVGNLDTQELIDHAEVYGLSRFNAGMKEVLDQM